MRARILGPIVVGLVAIASAGSADPPKRVGIADVKLHKATDYEGGPLGFDVIVQNATSIVAPGVQVIADVPSGGLLSTKIDIPALSSAKASFNDTFGFRSAAFCSGRQYPLGLESPAIRPEDKSRTMTITPTCTFDATAPDPTLQTAPDRESASEANTLYVSAIALDEHPTCGTFAHLKVTVVNKSKRGAHSVHLALEAPFGAVGASGEFNVPPVSAAGIAGSATVTFSANQAFGGIALVKIIDPANSMQFAIYDAGWNVQVKPKCSLATKISVQ